MKPSTRQRAWQRQDQALPAIPALSGNQSKQADVEWVLATAQPALGEDVFAAV